MQADTGVMDLAVPVMGGPAEPASRSAAEALRCAVAARGWVTDRPMHRIRLALVRADRSVPCSRTTPFLLRRVLTAVQSRRPVAATMDDDALYLAVCESTRREDDVPARRLVELITPAVARIAAFGVVASAAFDAADMNDEGALTAPCGLLAEMATVLATGESGVRVTTSDDVHPDLVLARLGTLTALHPEMLDGRVQRLRTLDEQSGSEFIRTLETYFRCSLSVGEASRALFIHPNTLRYRLRKMHEVAGLDVTDPTERLVAELQLRLLGERRWRRMPVGEDTSSLR